MRPITDEFTSTLNLNVTPPTGCSEALCFGSFVRADAYGSTFFIADAKIVGAGLVVHQQEVFLTVG